MLLSKNLLSVTVGVHLKVLNYLIYVISLYKKEKSETGVGCSKLLHIPPESFWCTAFSEQP